MKGKEVFTVGNIAAALLLTAAIITFSVTLTLNFRPLYYLDIKLLNIEEQSGYSESEIKSNYDALIKYNNITCNDELVFPTMKMSENARTHFVEVKRIFSIFQYGCLISAGLSAAAVFIQVMRRRYGFLKLTSVFSIGIPGIFGLLIAMNWERFFVRFHEIVFNNDYWLFDPAEDPVITILPDAFFMHCAVMILVLVVLGSVICALIYRKKNKS